MRRTALSVVAIAATCAFAQDETPVFKPTTIKAPFLEQFTDDWADRWTPSEATKKTPVGGETFSYVGQWSVEEAELAGIEGDKGLVAKTKAAHHAISAPFATPIDHTLKPLVVQYEVKYQKGGNCGGGYIKLLEDGFQTSGKEFTDTTPWTIMFGPDLTCPGNKIHFIFRHKHPITGEIEEKHLKAAPKPSFEKATNLFTLVVDQDSTFKLFFNENLEKEGSLLEEFEPPVNPPKEIDDPEDKKPEDWVDEKMIDDPEATKPEDWDEDAPYEIPDEDAEKPEGWLDDEPLTIPDPDAEKPEEWDDEEDGDWIAPTVSNSKCTEAPGCGEWKRPFKANPDYKGKWYAPRIDNPAYIGEWKPRQIENPTYFADITPSRSLANIGGVGIELWTMTEDVMFDNLYVGHSLDDAQALAKETWHVKKTLEAKTDKAVEEEDEDEPVFSEDPIGYIRYRILTFVDLAKLDPVLAFKTQPQTGAALAGVVFTFIGFLGAIFGIIGSQQKPVTKSAKKTDAVTPDVKGKETAPVAPAGGKTEETSVKKRAGKS